MRGVLCVVSVRKSRVEITRNGRVPPGIHRRDSNSVDNDRLQENVFIFSLLIQKVSKLRVYLIFEKLL